MIRTSGAKVVICIGEFLGVDYVALMRSGEPELAEELTFVVIGPTEHADVTSWDDYLAAAAGDDPDLADRSIDAVSPEDLSDIVFTSGTTGA